jgi:hypothetical protein
MNTCNRENIKSEHYYKLAFNSCDITGVVELPFSLKERKHSNDGL